MFGVILVIVWWISLGIAYKRGYNHAPNWFASDEGHEAIKRFIGETYVFLIERTPEDTGPPTVVRKGERADVKTMLKAWLQ